MNKIPENVYLRFNSDTLEALQKQYGFENINKMNESIDILEEWLNKQQHFVKKKMSREYLERVIIACKGSVERAKKKIDMVCTYRTLLPKFFELFDGDKKLNDKKFIDALLPNMTPDHCRVYLLKVVAENIDEDLTNFYRYITAMVEYIYKYDYCNGLLIIFDYSDASITDLVQTLNLIDAQQYLKLLTEAYGFRVKGMHIVTSSKLANLIVTFFKQAASEKIGKRIYLHKSYETLHDVIPREILPWEYGGNEKSLKEISENLINDLSTKEFTEHLKEMQSACTIEDLRSKCEFNNEFMGMPGTFRTLCLD